MAAAYSARFRNVRISRNTRRRRDSDEEPINIDFTRPPGINIHEFLYRCCDRDGATRGQRLAYLNALVKVFSALTEDQDVIYTREELIYCLRVPLLNETREVRAAGYRALRYLTRSQVDVRNIIRFQIPMLMVRSLDLIVDNQVERLQALRLARHMLSAAPRLFPADLTRCLLAIAADGVVERDKLWMITVATLTELSVTSPDLLTECGGVHVLLRCVLDSYQPRVVDAVLSALFRLVDRPHGCLPDLSLLLAPLADPHYGHHAYEAEHRSNQTSPAEMIRTAQVALLSVLRSWPGLLLIGSEHAGAFRALIESLHVDRPELRRALVEVVFELMGCEPPDVSRDPSALMKELAEGRPLPDACKLYEGFVAEEARLYLHHLGDTRPDLVMNHTALVLYMLLENGILEALVEVVVTADKSLCIAATMLIGELLYRVNELLPRECARFCHCLPTLLSRVSECGPTERTVTEAISLLRRIHIERRHRTLHRGSSLYFRQQMSFCGLDHPAVDVFDKAVKETSDVRVSDACVQSLVSTSKVLQTDEATSWRWEVVHTLITLSGSQHGSPLCPVLARLCTYLYPSSHQYLKQSCNKATTQQTSVLVDLVTALVDIDQTVCGTCCDLLDTLMLEICQFLRAAASKDPDTGHQQVTANALMTTCAQHYFLLLGRITSFSRGRDLMDQHRVKPALLDLINSSAWDYYVKLVISSIDFSHGRWAWKLLEQCLVASEEGKRLYCTQYLRLLARARCPGFARWGVELLVGQLYDRAERVAAAALQIVEEVCDYQPYLEAVVSQQPSVLSLGDGGVLLFARFLSVPAGFRTFQRASFLEHELDRWRNGFNNTYVSLVESELNDSLTRHQRSCGGGYGRRTGDRHQVRPVHLPFHLYGQLAHHRHGFELVRGRQEVADMVRLVKHSADQLSGSVDVRSLKVALWSLGNLGRTGLGLAWLRDAGVVSAVVRLSAGSPLLALRGTSCLVLGLLASTPQGAAALSAAGWEAVCRSWTERWALEEEKLDTRPPPVPTTSEDQTDRADVLSVSSAASTGSQGRPRTCSETSELAEDWGVGQARSATLPLGIRAGPAASGPQHVRSLSDASRHMVIPEFAAWESPPADQDVSPQGAPTSSAVHSSTESLSREHDTSNSKPLSPIASLGSLGDDATGNWPEPVCSALPLPAPVRPRLSSLSKSMSPPRHYPTEEDAQGYATLQGLTGRLRRSDTAEDVPRVGSSQQLLLEVTGRRSRPPTLELQLSRTLSFGQPSPSSPQPGVGSRRFSLTTIKRYRLQRTAFAPVYLGIALPRDLYPSLLTPPRQPGAARRQTSDDTEPEHSSRDVSVSNDEEGGLEFHNISNCLRCFTLKEREERRPRMRTDTESSTESSRQLSSPPQPESYLSHLGYLRSAGGVSVDIPSSITSVGSCTSIGSTDQLASGARGLHSSSQVRSLVRRDILRFVGALSTSVGAKAAEQGLLSLKQKFGGLLRTDLCLYSEIHQILSTYNFRLTSRRFLQELFEDVYFEEVESEALWILSRYRQDRLDLTFTTETLRQRNGIECPPDIPTVVTDDSLL